MSYLNDFNVALNNGQFNTCFGTLLFSKTIGERLAPPLVSLIAINEDNLNVVTDSVNNELTTN